MTVSAVIVLLPLFLGGNERIAWNSFVFLSLGYLLIAPFAAPRIFTSTHIKDTQLPYKLPFAWKVNVFWIAFLSLQCLQFVLMPLDLLESVSPWHGTQYRAVGATWGFLTAEFSTTLLAWSGAGALLAWYQLSALSDPVRARGLSGQIETAVIFASYLLSVIALLHWSARAELYWGFFGSERGANPLRAHWPFVNPNHLAAFLEMGIILSWGKFIVSRRRRSRRRSGGGIDRVLTRWLGRLGGALFLLLTLVFTFSRAGIVLSLGGIAVLEFLAWRFNREEPAVSHSEKSEPIRSRWLTLGLRAGGIILCLALLTFYLGETGQEIAIERLETGMRQGSTEVRRLLAGISWELFLRSPIFGVGFGCWPLAAYQIGEARLARYSLSFAHSDPLQLLAEVGITGIVLLLPAVVVACRAWGKGMKSADNPLPLLVTGIAVILPLLHSLVDFPFHIPGIVVAFVALLASLARRIDMEKPTDFYGKGSGR